jgi:hypothetical protein
MFGRRGFRMSYRQKSTAKRFCSLTLALVGWKRHNALHWKYPTQFPHWNWNVRNNIWESNWGNWPPTHLPLSYRQLHVRDGEWKFLPQQRRRWGEREESAGSTVSQSAQLGSINSKYHLSVRVANKKTEGNTLSPIYHKAQCYGTKRHTRLNEYRHPSPTANLKHAQFSIDMQFFSA